MLFFLVLRTFVYSLPDSFNTLSATIVKHLRFFFKIRYLAKSGKGTQLKNFENLE